MSWQSDVVDHLLLSKRAGENDFNAAWLQALVAHPPRGRDMDPREPTLFDPEDKSLVGFFRRACADAWEGRRPALAKFRPDLLMPVEDDSTSARRVGHVRAAPR